MTKYTCVVCVTITYVVDVQCEESGQAPELALEEAKALDDHCAIPDEVDWFVSSVFIPDDYGAQETKDVGMDP